MEGLYQELLVVALAEAVSSARHRVLAWVSVESASMGAFELVWPSAHYLPSYVDALQRGWSSDNLRGEAAAREELERIALDSDAFLASLVDREARGAPIVMPDGSTVPRLPGYSRWIWDGEFCGSIGLRWSPGTEALPPHCLGHIGYSVVPWKRGRGYARRALALLLPEASREGLRYVEITTTPNNSASQRVIEANGGVLHEEFISVPALGSKRQLRYRIALRAGPGGAVTEDPASKRSGTR
jgi:predicted acetyltransferase